MKITKMFNNLNEVVVYIDRIRVLTAEPEEPYFKARIKQLTNGKAEFAPWNEINKYQEVWDLRQPKIQLLTELPKLTMGFDYAIQYFEPAVDLIFKKNNQTATL